MYTRNLCNLTNHCRPNTFNNNKFLLFITALHLKAQDEKAPPQVADSVFIRTAENVPPSLPHRLTSITSSQNHTQDRAEGERPSVGSNAKWGDSPKVSLHVQVQSPWCKSQSQGSKAAPDWFDTKFYLNSLALDKGKVLFSRNIKY